MRILIVADEGKGGAEAVMLSQAAELERQGVEVKIVRAFMPIPKILPKILRYQSISERYRNWRMVWNPAGIKLMRKVLAEFKPDVVHAHNIHNQFSFAVLPLAKKAGAKVFLTAHDSYLFYPAKYYGQSDFWYQLRTQRFRFNPFRTFLIKRYIKSVDRIFAVSDALKSALKEHGFQSTTLHNGIDAVFWQRPVPETHKPTFLFSGRPSVGKGLNVLSRVTRSVRDKIPNAELVTLGVTKWIPKNEIPDEYAKADVIIVPSVYLDPFPTVVLEAGAAGKPVVVTNYGGAKEAVIDGVTGFICDPYSSTFADRIIELLQNSEKASRMGQKAREHIQQNFSLQEQVKKMLEYYTQAD